MIEYLTRNDVKVSIADSPVTADGKTLPAGTAVVSMYQAKRSVANAVLYEGTFISTWDFLSNDAVAAFNYILTGTGVKDPDFTARVIGKTPVVYISGTKEALTKDPEGFVYNTLVSYSNDYSNDRTAMEQMGFDTTEDASAADAVAGGADLDEESLAAVQAGVPYVGYTDYAAESIQEYFLPDVQIGCTDGIDCLGYATYPEETLVNASYIRDGDNIFYSSSTNYFTALPEGARILVQRGGSRVPLEGYLVGDEESRNAFLNGIMGFSYEGPDKDGNEVNITLFANTMTERGHQRDEYAFISNALFASFLTDTPYVSAASSAE